MEGKRRERGRWKREGGKGGREEGVLLVVPELQHNIQSR